MLFDGLKREKKKEKRGRETEKEMMSPVDLVLLFVFLTPFPPLFFFDMVCSNS